MKKLLVLLALLTNIGLSQSIIGIRDIGADSTWFKYLVIQSDLADTLGFAFKTNANYQLFIDPSLPTTISALLSFGSINTPVTSEFDLTSHGLNSISLATVNGSSQSNSLILSDASGLIIVTGKVLASKMPISFQISSSEAARIDTFKNLLIGTTVGDSLLTVNLGGNFKRGLRVQKGLTLDSTGTPSTPAQAMATLYSQGVGKLKVIYSDGSSHNLDSVGAGGSSHAILSATHSDATTSTVVRGDLVVGNSTPAWTRLAKGATNTVYQADANDVVANTNLKLSNISAPATPAAGTMALFALNDNTTTTMTVINDLGRKIYLGEGSWRNRRPFSVFPSATSISSITVYGSLSSGIASLTGTWTGVNMDDDGPRRTLPSGSSSNNEAGYDFATGAGFMEDFNMDVTIKCKIVTTTSRRFWFGLFDVNPMASDALTDEHVGIRLSTSASNVNWVLSTGDGATQSLTQLITADAAVHTFRLVVDIVANARVGVSVDGGAVTWKTTNLPATGTILGLWARLRTLTAAAATWDWWWTEGYTDK